ncbi:hypothetical protein [Nonomuraea sp. SYSU D8015]|uniref:hypothetical protein n=1 Tax=Nonomuraea sp. SYSU D8015 TaxID=2593644 RepID=UPI0016609CCB|nr:hypothetical protein [Nonomuraea sp. SYSU D8015]
MAEESAPPDTADEVRHALSAPDRRWSGSALLVFPAAVGELLAWLEDDRNFSAAHHVDAFRSAIREYRTAEQEGLGFSVAAVLRTHLGKVSTALQQLNPAGNRAVAITAVQDLQSALKDQQVLQAAWKDLWSKCSKLETSAEAIAVRRDLFLALARLAGHDLGQLASTLSDVLADTAWAVTGVRTALGDLAPDVLDENEHELPRAGLKTTERATLCERVLALPPAAHSHVVWLAYEKASMFLKPIASLGDITFIMSEYVPDEATAASAKYSSYCMHWTETDGEFLADMPHKVGTVLARVFLPPRIYADPIAVARTRVEALVMVGKFHAGMPAGCWRILPGHKHIPNGQRGEERRIEVSSYTVAPLDHGRQAAIYSEMATFWKQIDGTVAIDDAGLAEAVELLRWWQAAEEQSSLAQVIANVRVVETAAARVGTAPWEDHLAAYLKPTWVVQAIHEDLVTTIRHAASREPTGLTVQAYKRRQAVRDATLDFHEFGYIDLVPGSTQDALTEFIDIYPPHHQMARRLRTLAKRLDNRDAFEKWRAQLETRWGRLADRMARTRNAITHGGPATAEVVGSIAAFSRQMGAWEVQIALESALAGTGLIPAHIAFRKDSTTLLERMRQAAKPGDVIHSSAVPPHPR